MGQYTGRPWAAANSVKHQAHNSPAATRGGRLAAGSGGAIGSGAFGFGFGETREAVFDADAEVTAIFGESGHRFVIRFLGRRQAAMLQFQVAQGEQRLDGDGRLPGAQRDFDAGAAGFPGGGQLFALMMQNAESAQSDRLSGPGTAPRRLRDGRHAAVHGFTDPSTTLVPPGFQEKLSSAQNAVDGACVHVPISLTSPIVLSH